MKIAITDLVSWDALRWMPRAKKVQSSYCSPFEIVRHPRKKKVS